MSGVCSDVSRLLIDWRNGDPTALEKLTPLVYVELRRLARGQMRQERPGHTLEPTGLIHEAYLRLVGQSLPEWQNRAHFFAVAAQIMRQVLVDHARRVRSEKRGCGNIAVTLFDFDGAACPFDERLLAVDEALSKLETLDPRAAKVIELRFFGGLTETEAAEALDISIATLKRDWDFGRSWLATQLA